jgi:hypothetical protein
MLRVGILYRAQDLLETVQSQLLSEDEFHSAFPVFENVSSADVLGVSKKCGWVQASLDGHLVLSESGIRLLNQHDYVQRLRIQVSDVLMNYKPSWAGLLVRGRHAVSTFADPDATQCFSDAELLNTVDKVAVDWWDSLASRLRGFEEAARVATGRIGERLSIQAEENRTGRTPKWIALEDNNAGYDLVSSVGIQDEQPLVIEVKASTLAISHARYFLSRHEWDVLSTHPNAELHLWHSVSSKPALIRIPIARVTKSIPIDQASGEWQRVRIPFADTEATNTLAEMGL